MMTLSDIPVFIMSSYQWSIRNGNGKGMEAGAVPDLPIERIETTDEENPFPRAWFRATVLPIIMTQCWIKMMNEWFAQEEAPAA